MGPGICAAHPLDGHLVGLMTISAATRPPQRAARRRPARGDDSDSDSDVYWGVPQPVVAFTTLRQAGTNR